MSPYLEKGLFSQLKDRRVFNSVRPFLGSVQWENGLDLCPDTLYLDSQRPAKTQAGDIGAISGK